MRLSIAVQGGQRQMGKIAGWIVDKSKLVLIVMAALAVVGGVLMLRVGINTDMTKYLPDDSSMKQGIDRMAEEFPDMQTTQTIRVMFQGLAPEQGPAVREALGRIPNVARVEHEADSADYEKDGHTLFVVHTTYDYGSPEERAIETALCEDFADYDMVFKNDNTVSSDVPVWILAVGVAVILAVLLAMCGSWVEPFLFLIAIGCAILINMGTNIFLGSISNITFSIAAILQLVLSMDYSIILMNRYRQELAAAGGQGPVPAMKRALAKAFSSITSSSVTTIVGLLALVFMRFKIGFDLGVVLAKGVLISMLCIFTMLPGMILLCDGLIRKTAKKALDIPMGAVARFGGRARYVIALGFLALFVGAYFLQGRTQIAYTLNTEDPIAEVFPPSNPIIMLYSNDDEAQAAEIAEELEADAHVKSAMNYSTTLGRPYTVEGLTSVIDAMGGGQQIDPSLLRILYYNYYADGETSPMTAHEFLTFLSGRVLKNDAFSAYLTGDMRANAAQLEKFADRVALTTPMDAAGLSAMFGIGTQDVQALLLYYAVQNGMVDTGSMTLAEFTDLILNDVAGNPQYAAMLDAQTLAQVRQLQTYTDAQRMTTLCTAGEIAQMLGIDANQAVLLFAYHYASDPGYDPGVMTLPAFLAYLCDDVAQNPLFSGQFDAAALQQLQQLRRFTDPALLQTPMTNAQLSELFGINPLAVELVMTLHHGIALGKTMTPVQFVDTLLSAVSGNVLLQAYVGAEQLQQLQFLQTAMHSTLSGTAYGAVEMAALLGLDTATMRVLYTVRAAQNGGGSGWRLSMQTVVGDLVNNSQAGAMLDAAQLQQLQMAKRVIDGAVAGTRYTADALAELLGMDAAQLHQLYLLRMTGQDAAGVQLSPQAFVDFLAGSVLNNSALSGSLDASSAQQLRAAQALIRAVTSGQRYSASEMASLLSGLGGGVDAASVEMIYLYAASVSRSDPEWKLSMEELFSYLTGTVLEDPRFSTLISDDFRTGIDAMRVQIEEGIAQLRGPKHSILMFSTTFPAESAETTAFFDRLTALSAEKLQGDSYLIGNSAMSYEMAQSFDHEMLVITLLTALAIFLVVALTFRSLAIPTILVLIVQCGVYLTISVIGLQGYSIYYLALLVVQCILMGATIDYGILFTNYYRENREAMDVPAALAAAYRGASHTIFTSGTIMILATGVVSYCFTDPTISQICRTISVGALCASLLILFILPGLLAALDRLLLPRGKRRAPAEKHK